MEQNKEKNLKEFNVSTLMKIHFKPEYSNLFREIKQIHPVKNDILMALLDGNWHSENEIIKVIRKKHQYMGSVTLASMISSLNRILKKNHYLEKKIIYDKIFYKLSDNYLGLTKTLFTRFRSM